MQSQFLTKPPSREESLDLPKGFLQDSNRCLAELQLEECGVPDLLQTWPEYYLNHWRNTSLWSMICTIEVVCQMVVSKMFWTMWGLPAKAS